MAINGVGHNYDYLGTTTNYIRGKATVREAISKMVKQSANLSISDAGRNMLREMASKFEPDSDYTNVREQYKIQMRLLGNTIPQCGILAA